MDTGETAAAAPPSAPEPIRAPRGDAVDTRHGRRLPDPYRGLEDRGDPARRRFAAAHDARARRVLDALPGRDALAADLAAVLSGGEDGVGHRVGPRTLALRRRPGAGHPVLEARDEPRDGSGGTTVLLDPLALDPTGATVVDGWWPGPGGRRVAVATSDPAHASRLRILDAATGELLEGPVERTALSPVAWLPGEDELVWVRQDPDDPRRRCAWRHRVGASGSDTPIEGDGLDAEGLYLGVRAGPDGRRLVLDAAVGTAPGDGLWLVDLTTDAPARRVLSPDDGVSVRAALPGDGRLWLVTTLDAPRGRLCVADPDDPDPARWREIVGEDPRTVLSAARLVGRTALLVRSRDGADELHRHDPADGRPLGAVALPGIGVVTGLGTGPGSEVDVGWSTPTTPTRVLRVDADRGTVATVVAAAPPRRANGTSAPQDASERAVRSAVRRVPARPTTERLATARVLVTGRRDGPAPTILTGYGGFGHVAGPAFSPLAAAWVAAGGAWARAVLRGGGEDGRAGHDAGRGEHLLAGTDDLLAAADALVAAGVTTRDRLALFGTSHGGLRVAQALVARPDAVAAIAATAPLADLVRSELLGPGRAWTAEYGRAEDADEHARLVAGSPYHRVAPGTAYPPVLVTASDADTRVDVAHALKLVAALEHAGTGGTGTPPLLRRETDTGHGPRSVARTVAHAVDVLAFLADATGLALPR